MGNPLKAGSFPSGLARAVTVAFAFICLAFAVSTLDVPSASAKARVNPDANGKPIFVPTPPPAKEKPSLPPFSPKPEESDNTATKQTLADEATGATVTGLMEDGAVLRVARGCDGGILHVAGECDACDMIRDAIPTADYLQPYMVEVEGNSGGSMDGSFEVGTEFNGRMATIYHCKDGSLKRKPSTVEEGRVKTSFEAGKRFAVVIPERPESTPEEDEPPYIIVAFVLGAIAYGLYRMKRRTGSGLR